MRAAGDYRCGRAWLDRQYDARGSVADAELYLERRRTWSRHIRRRLQFGGDLHFGPGPRERLDLFTPATPSPWPIVIYVHGGYWRANDKQDSSFVAASLVPLGIAVAVVDYPLMPGPTMDSVVGSVRTAAAWLHACAAGLGLDASRLFVVGHSSGGHLGAMIAAEQLADGVRRPGRHCQGSLPDQRALRLGATATHTRERMGAPDRTLRTTQQSPIPPSPPKRESRSSGRQPGDR